jgi:hypothetical protein
MTKEVILYQCLLTQARDGAWLRVVAWIEARGAVRGKKVELKGEEGLWDVDAVYAPARAESWVKDNAARAHKGTRGFSDI